MALYDDAPRLPETEPLNPELLVGSKERVELEIGPGRGWFMVERLEARPDIGMIGLEIRRKWASIVDARLKTRGFGERARVFAEDAREALKRVADGSLSTVYLHFPDPWWKKRHAKRLVLGRPLISELSRVIQRGGELFVQTDVASRADQYEDLIAEFPQFSGWHEGSPRIQENPYQARSPRERRAIQDGLPIVRLRYRRV
jgi:tRNA (guanine-N7-)-methyltransferase